MLKMLQRTKPKAQNKKKRSLIIKCTLIGIGAYLLLTFYVIHVVYLMRSGGNLSLFDAINGAMRHIITAPFDLKPFPVQAFAYTALITIVIGFLAFIAISTQKLKKTDDLKTIAGEATLMSKKDLDKYNTKFTEPLGHPYAEGYNNAIFSKEIMLSMRAFETRRNLNALIIGGSGTGKSFREIAPNILQRNSSLLITDPSGELYDSYAAYLEYYGYKIKCFNLDRFENSNLYNPFDYIFSDKDIAILVTMLINNTKLADKTGGDEFWEKSEIALYSAFIAYLHHFAPKEERSFARVFDVLRRGADMNDDGESGLDMIFTKIKRDHPESYCAAQWDIFNLAPAKTKESILISAGVRLQAFAMEEIRRLTSKDTIDLERIADEKTAIFIIVPTGEKTFNFIAGLLYSQLFTRLYSYCQNNAMFGYYLKSPDGEVIRAFRAENFKDSENAKAHAEEFQKLAMSAKIINNPKMAVTEGNRKAEFWEIRNGDTLLGFRGTKELAQQALKDMQEATIESTRTLSNGGRRCPIHVRFLLDEFANTGKIPDFVEKISTIRKYELSTTIILQSLGQLKNLYKDEWSGITSNCDTTVYLGGGNDQETTEWISKLAGKKTVVSRSENYSKSGGSQTISRTGQELITPSSLRTMDDTTCIVMPRGMNTYKGPMYDTTTHPEWKLRNRLPGYLFSPTRYAYINKESLLPFEKEKKVDSTVETIPEEAPDDATYRKEENAKAEQRADEVTNNMDQGDAEPVANDTTMFDPLHPSAEDNKAVQAELAAEDPEDDIPGGTMDDDTFDELWFDVGDSDAFFGAASMEDSTFE